MTTLDPHDIDEQLAAIDLLRSKRPDGFGLKDGFCQLDLSAHGFRILFEASWLWAPAEPSREQSLDGWVQIQTPEDLAEWEDAWQRLGSPADQRVFPDALLFEETIGFFGRKESTGYVSGCIANRSDGCVGFSNVFGPGDVTDAAAIAAQFGSGMPIVGYDSGEALRAMKAAGFKETGRLRVWLVGD